MLSTVREATENARRHVEMVRSQVTSPSSAEEVARMLESFADSLGAIYRSIHVVEEKLRAKEEAARVDELERTMAIHAYHHRLVRAFQERLPGQPPPEEVIAKVMQSVQRTDAAMVELVARARKDGSDLDGAAGRLFDSAVL